MSNIVLIGAGNIGSRHLQGLARINVPISIYVIDPSQDSLTLSKARFEEVDGHLNANIKSIEFTQDMSLFKRIQTIDIAIVATFSDIRATIVQNLISEYKIKNLILEKVVFQSGEEFKSIISLIEQNSINAWVNCPRRYWEGYKRLKKQIVENMLDLDELIVNISGSNLGIGCNGIHFIDIIFYLIDEVKEEYYLIPEFNEEVAKIRNGKFYEVTGTLKGKIIRDSNQRINSKKVSFQITSFKDGEAPISIEMRSAKFSININERTGKIKSEFGSNGWNEEEFDLGIIYQSSLTNIIVLDILQNQNCSLTTLKESAYHHIPFLKTLLEFFNKQMHEQRTRCPIT